MIKKKKPKNFVDVGCGYDALLLQRLRFLDCDLKGIDIGTNKAIEGVILVDCVIKDFLPLDSNSVDFINMNNVLEHLDLPLAILSDAYRALSVGGTLHINVPSWFGKRYLEFSAFKMGFSAIVELNDHKMYYGIRDLWPLVVKAGFKPIDIRIGYHKLFLNTYCEARKSASLE